jgi:phosphoglycerate dehydrogenase-like enzyme
MKPNRIAVLDDWQGIAKEVADWSALDARADVIHFTHSLGDVDSAAAALADFDILIAMRERMPLPGVLIEKLPKLKLIALTGVRSGTLDLAACAAHGVLVCNTGSDHSTAATAELALTLLLAAARRVPIADRAMREGRFQEGVPTGIALSGRTLGVLGLGKIGRCLAGYGRALGMDVIAWSQNMTAETAQAAGARLVDKATLFAASDAITLHVVLSERTRGVVDAEALARMKPGAILVNTSRGPLIDEGALVARLRTGLLTAGLDVYDREPLPVDHPLRTLPNVVLTPHLGYCTRDVYAQFYRESIENVIAFLDGKPMRVLKAT